MTQKTCKKCYAPQLLGGNLYWLTNNQLFCTHEWEEQPHETLCLDKFTKETKMPIKFIVDENQSLPLVYSSVQKGQFFIDIDGDFCQGYAYDSYIIIADKDGTPKGDRSFDVDDDVPIQRILPKIKKIEF